MVYITSFTLKEKKHSYSICTVFVCGCLSAAVFIFFLSRFLKGFFTGIRYFFLPHKCSILDVAGVLNPQYAPTWIAYTNNVILVSGKR